MYSFDFCFSLITITLPESITSIEDCAFYNCMDFETIYYLGTEEQWNMISKSPKWDELLGKHNDLGNYTVQFNVSA